MMKIAFSIDLISIKMTDIG